MDCLKLRITKQVEMKWMLVLLLFIMAALPVSAAYSPAWYKTTADLRIRKGPSTSYDAVYTAPKGVEILVLEQMVTGWSKVVYVGDTLYAKSSYLSYYKPYRTTKKAVEKEDDFSWWSLLWSIVWRLVVIYIIRWILIVFLGFFSQFVYKAYWLLNLPFYFLNWLQRCLSKPWRYKYKYNYPYRNYKNEKLREEFEMWKIPLYVILTPLRFVNAAYYNILIHVGLEMFNYVVEVLLPSKESEGSDNILLWYILMPWRFLRYVCFHGTLTFVESCIWTVIDTFIPALTLYHGTSVEASISIMQSPSRTGNKDWLSGTWNVGGGNYAGNGIYFAPERSTSLHYASGALIICRVSLGKVIDLGLAPYEVYSACGHPNALIATKWGLTNGYTTGEWWRSDEGWWEYCMYDWQNRYNESWRIRPIYVLNLADKYMQRVPCGMYHWLFSQQVIKDIIYTLNKKFG